MKKVFLISILLLFCVISINGFAHAEDFKTKIVPKVMSKSEAGLRSSMRMLWESRAILLRAYIVSATNDFKDADEARDGLLKNAADLGASIRPYYGYWASGFLTGFLKNDVRLTEEVITSVKTSNKEALDLANKAKEEALDLTNEAKEEALDMAKKDNKEAPRVTEKSNIECLDLTVKAKEEALDLTVKAKEEALNLTEKAKETALDLTKKNNKESPDITEKTALELTEKAKEKALALTEKAKETALELAEKCSKESPDLTKKAKGKALGMIEMAQEIARNLIKKAKEIARDMTKRANKDALDQAKKRWYENARDLAGFFAITHNQTKKDLTNMLCKHLDLTWGEIQAIFAKDEKKDMDYYEKDRAHMVMFSNILTDGIVKQFPDRFKE